MYVNLSKYLLCNYIYYVYIYTCIYVNYPLFLAEFNKP